MAGNKGAPAWGLQVANFMIFVDRSFMRLAAASPATIPVPVDLLAMHPGRGRRSPGTDADDTVAAPPGPAACPR